MFCCRREYNQFYLLFCGSSYHFLGNERATLQQSSEYCIKLDLPLFYRQSIGAEIVGRAEVHGMK